MTTPRRFDIPVLILLILGLGVFGYSEYTARIAAEQRANRLEQELARRQTAAIAKSPEPVASSAEPMPAPVEASADQAVPVATAAAQGQPFPRGGPGADWQALMESPEIQQLMSLRARGQLDGRYAALFAKLRLSPAQLERLQQLLVDKQNTMRDVTAAMREQGLSTRRDNADQMRSLVQNANAEIDNQIRAELGEAVYAQYQEYERTQPQRNFVDRVQQRLSYSGEPLSDTQAASLVAVLAQPATVESSPARGPFGGRGSGGNVTLSDASVAQAGTFLSASQVRALQDMQREQQAQAELARLARESFNNRRNAAAGPGAP